MKVLEAVHCLRTLAEKQNDESAVELFVGVKKKVSRKIKQGANKGKTKTTMETVQAPIKTIEIGENALIIITE